MPWIIHDIWYIYYKHVSCRVHRPVNDKSIPLLGLQQFLMFSSVLTCRYFDPEWRKKAHWFTSVKPIDRPWNQQDIPIRGSLHNQLDRQKSNALVFCYEWKTAIASKRLLVSFRGLPKIDHDSLACSMITAVNIPSPKLTHPLELATLAEKVLFCLFLAGSCRIYDLCFQHHIYIIIYI